jgi:hypothetical protein
MAIRFATSIVPIDVGEKSRDSSRINIVILQKSIDDLSTDEEYSEFERRWLSAMSAAGIASLKVKSSRQACGRSASATNEAISD